VKRLAIVMLGLSLLSGPALCSFAAEKSVTGDLRDSFCYVSMGAQGASHKKCAVGCAKKGIPVTLVEKGTGKAYILLPAKNDEPLPDTVVNKMEEQVTITGSELTKDGLNYLTVGTVK
jgi:hypothetical protein